MKEIKYYAVSYVNIDISWFISSLVNFGKSRILSVGMLDINAVLNNQLCIAIHLDLENFPVGHILPVKETTIGPWTWSNICKSLNPFVCNSNHTRVKNRAPQPSIPRLDLNVQVNLFFFGSKLIKVSRRYYYYYNICVLSSRWQGAIETTPKKIL